MPPAAEHDVDKDLLILPAGPEEEDGVAATGHLLTFRPLPTALIAFNDRCAIGAIGALHAPDWPCHRRCRWSATTTAGSPGSPTST